MRLIAEQTILSMAQGILHGFPGAQVYLFGSYAYGRPGKHSDIDLAVIHEDWLHPHEVARQARRLAGHVEIPKDVIAIPAARFAVLSEMAGTLSYKIKHEGILLHGSVV
ncbi:MAG: nucleotidyltransferase domain-containing protein [Pseudomonadota bacterium]